MKMRILVLLGLGASLIYAQTKSVEQVAGDCSLNINGNNNRVSLVCNGLDRKLAEQIQALLVSTRRDQSITAEKLELILNQLEFRRLTQEQQLSIGRSLCEFGPANVQIETYNSNAEIRRLADDIAGALPEDCKFVLSRSPKTATLGFTGIQVVLPDGSAPKEEAFAKAIVAALSKAGLHVVGPMPPPRRGGELAGGADFKRSTEVIGRPVEIAIGEK